MAEDDSYDQLYKIILIGDASVGKSNILSRYLSNVFKQDTKSTVGVEFGSKKVSVNGVNVKLQIWDTAGQERYRAITSAYYKGSKGCIIVYDITSEKSFEDVEKWYEEINKTAGKDICIVLVGNKCDLESERKVSIEMGENKAKNLGFAFFETSALSNIQIGKAFPPGTLHRIVCRRQIRYLCVEPQYRRQMPRVIQEPRESLIPGALTIFSI